MTTKKITYQELSKAIRAAFDSDKELLEKFYDPNVKVNDVDEAVKDVSRKVATFSEAEYRGVYDKNELVGYFVFRNKLLISFGLNIGYRTRNYLREFFRLIRTEIKGKFGCLLFARNVRAIKFLVKQGMELMFTDGDLATLVLK